MPIIFNPCGMVEMIKSNPATALNKEFCETHVCSVWEAISLFVVQQLCKGKGVRIPGIGTITYKTKVIEMSQREVIVQKVPHLLLSAEMEKRHALNVKRPAYNLNLPVVDVNFSAISQMTCITRCHTILILDEIRSAINRAILCDPQVEIWFPKIGRVVIQCQDVDVIFCTEFLNMLGLSSEYIQDKSCPLR